jgi:DNA sulfur modification protein DndD
MEKKKIEDEIQKYDKLIAAGLSDLTLPFEVNDPELKVKIAQRFPIDPEELEARKRDLKRKKEDLESKTVTREETKGQMEKSKQKIDELEERLEASELARQLSERFEKSIETRRKDVLQQIEVRALSYYKRMTDQHDYDAIRIDPESYEVSIHPKNLTEYIPARRDGGGHQTLIALAVRLALLEALNFRSLLILDEPTYGVDSENLPPLADYFGEASRMVAQTILVTHHNICEEEASNIVEVGRSDDGASLVKARS